MGIPLTNASICCECDLVFDDQVHREGCPRCASTAVVPLVCWVTPMPEVRVSRPVEGVTCEAAH